MVSGMCSPLEVNRLITRERLSGTNRDERSRRFTCRQRAASVPSPFGSMRANSCQVLSRSGNPVRVGIPIRRRNFLEKVAVPQFEDQQAPDSIRMVATLSKVLVEQSPYALRLEISSLQRSGLQQNRHD